MLPLLANKDEYIDLLDVLSPLAHRVVTRYLDLKQVVVSHVRRQLGRALTTTATDA